MPSESPELCEGGIAGCASVDSHGKLVSAKVELRMSNACVSAVFTSWPIVDL